MGLNIKSDGTYLDGTFGRGGHARAILSRLGDAGRLLLMDKDPQAISAATERFGSDPRVRIRHGSFADLAEWGETGNGLDGVLLDLGVSSPQLDQAERGFSFLLDGPLDMRMDPHQAPSAAEWLAQADEREIAQVLHEFGEERKSRAIARHIVHARGQQPLQTTRQLAELVAQVVGWREPGKHPATRTFQAIRLFVNQELDALRRGLKGAVDRLKAGGRLAVITFHSLEDRIVKHFFRDACRDFVPAPRGLPQAARAPTLKIVGKPQKPGAEETRHNPRSRSALLRVAEKIA